MRLRLLRAEYKMTKTSTPVSAIIACIRCGSAPSEGVFCRSGGRLSLLVAFVVFGLGSGTNWASIVSVSIVLRITEKGAELLTP